MEYTASIVYNRDSLKELSHTVNNTFHFRQKVVYVLICIILLICGCAFGFQTAKGIICIACACVLLPSVKVLDNRRVNLSLRLLGTDNMTVHYVFSENCFACYSGKERNEFMYSEIVRLVTEKSFFYMFPNSTQAMMIDKKSLEPKNEEKFQDFIKKKTGLEWTKPMSVFTVSLRQIRFNKKNTRLTKVIKG